MNKRDVFLGSHTHLYNTKNIFFTALFVVGILAALAVLWVRIYYSVEVTDEAFFNAEPYLIIKGAVPVATLWSQTPLTNLLTLPFVQFFVTATGGTEGIMLFMRQVAFLFRLSIAVAVFCTIKGVFSVRASALYSLAVFASYIICGENLNYNNMAVYLLWLGATMLFAATQTTSNKKACTLYIISGGIMALCAVAHSTFLLSCILLAVLLLFAEKRKLSHMPLPFLYVLSGTSVALLFFLGLVIAAGGVTQLLNGMFEIQQFNYFRIPTFSLSQQITMLWNEIYRLYLRPFIWPLTGTLLLLFFMHIRFPSRKVGHIFYALALLFTCYAVLRLVYYDTTTQRLTNYLQLSLLLFLPFYLVPLQKEGHLLKQYALFLVAPSLLQLFVVSLSAHGSIITRMYLVICPAMLVILAATCMRTKLLKTTTQAFALFSGVLNAVLATIIIAGGIYSQYAYVYRDAPIAQLTARVNTGVYKGLFTTPPRAQAIEQIETQIRAHTNSNETVLFADLMPAAYLMTDAQPLTPTTWDPPMYRYGFQDADHYLRFFDVMGKMPDHIIYINSEGKPMSINDKQNEFASFVHQNYRVAYTNDAELFAITIFEKE